VVLRRCLRHRAGLYEIFPEVDYIQVLIPALTRKVSYFVLGGRLHVIFLFAENRGFRCQDANFALKLGSLASERRRSYLPDFLRKSGLRDQGVF
jgi:hypothetical protein